MNDRPGLLQCINATCRDATRMLSQGETRRLTWAERLGLSMHLLICRPCRQYRRATLLLRSLLRRSVDSGALDASEKLPPPARDRIREKLVES